MDILILALAAFFTSCIIFFSGFGLGTVLLPVFALFFPLEAAVGLTDAVHFLNNTFNFFIIKKEYDIEILQKFGIPSVLGAVIGLSRSTSNCLSFQIRSVQRSFDISGIIIACAVDFTRITVYMQKFLQLNLQNVLPGLTVAVLSAFPFLTPSRCRNYLICSLV